MTDATGTRAAGVVVGQKTLCECLSSQPRSDYYWLCWKCGCRIPKATR